MSTTLQSAGEHVYGATLIPSAAVTTVATVALAELVTKAPRRIVRDVGDYGNTVISLETIAKRGACSPDVLKMAKVGGAAAIVHGFFNLASLDKDHVSQVGSLTEMVGGGGLMAYAGLGKPRAAIAFGSLAVAGAAANVVSGIKMAPEVKYPLVGGILGAGLGSAAMSWSPSLVARGFGMAFCGAFGVMGGMGYAEKVNSPQPAPSPAIK